MGEQVNTNLAADTDLPTNCQTADVQIFTRFIGVSRPDEHVSPSAAPAIIIGRVAFICSLINDISATANFGDTSRYESLDEGVSPREEEEINEACVRLCLGISQSSRSRHQTGSDTVQLINVIRLSVAINPGISFSFSINIETPVLYNYATTRKIVSCSAMATNCPLTNRRGFCLWESITYIARQRCIIYTLNLVKLQAPVTKVY